MQTIALFSRLRLSELFVELDVNLHPHFNILHIAYSESERAFILGKLPNATVISFREVYDRCKRDIAHIKLIDKVELDNEIRLLSKGRSNLNAIINADRTLLGMAYNDCIRIVRIYLESWKIICREFSFDFLLHEPVTLALTELGYYVAQSNSSRYLALIQSYGIHTNNFLLVDALNGEIFDRSTKKLVGEETIDLFLDKYHNLSAELYSQYSTRLPSKEKLIINATETIIFDILRKIRGLIIRFSLSDTRSDVIDIYHNRTRSLWDKISSTLFYYNLNNYDDFLTEETFYYYPLHMEPEATVLYWGRNKYTGQVKLIENIASQLPNGELLYVKDHPHAGSYRSIKDYHIIKAIPNVRLINPGVPGTDIIRMSKGVITICGTSGFEALLYHKPVYLFGNTFYKMYEGVIRLESVFDLGRILEGNGTKTVGNSSPRDIAKQFLSLVMEGFTDYFVDYPEKSGIDHKENGKVVAKEISWFLRR